MRTSQGSSAPTRRISRSAILLILGVTFALCCASLAQQGKGAPAKTSLTGRYDGTAKNKAEEVITVSLDLTEKEGTFSGMINSSHGNFTITGGSRQGDTATIEFDVGGPTGTLSLHITEDKLVGTWNAGEDGGAVDVKKVVKEEPKGK